MTIKSQTEKKYRLIEALANSWCTVEELEEYTGLSRSQLFRTFKQLKAEYDIEIEAVPLKGNSYNHYRLSDSGIINMQRFKLMRLAREPE